jgi:hypothetical protein
MHDGLSNHTLTGEAQMQGSTISVAVIARLLRVCIVLTLLASLDRDLARAADGNPDRGVFVLGETECPALGKEACARWQRQRDLLAWIEVENAESDAIAAIAAGDFRLYGTYGVSVVVLEAGLAGLIPNGCSLRMIEGTSDAIDDAESAFRALEYAKRYNRTILSKSHCLSKPISRLGMHWSSYIAADHQDSALGDYQNLEFGNGGYDLVFFYCKNGELGLTLMRPRAAFRRGQIKIESGRFSTDARAKVTPLPEDFHRRDLATVGAIFISNDLVFTEFVRTGSIKIAGESFDASTNTERAAIRNFVAACRKAE